MSKRRLLLPLILLVALPTHADGAPEQAVVVPQLKEQLQQGDAQVARLQQEVHSQESRSQQARERLRERDRRIADLQRRLQALRAGQGPLSPGR